MRFPPKVESEWRRWFAWYSARLPDGTLVWWEWVERRRVYIDNPDAMRGDIGGTLGWWEWEYRLGEAA